MTRMDWTRVNADLAWGPPPDAAGLRELAEAGFRTLVEARRASDRALSLPPEASRWFAMKTLAVDGWPADLFRRLAHLLQTGEPGPVYLIARHPEDGAILAWVWEAVRSKRSVFEMRDRAAREGVELPLGAWEFLAARESGAIPAPP